MKLNLIVSVLIVIFTVQLKAQSRTENIKVFYLGGQSNMSGFGYSKDLPNTIKKPLKDVFIFQGNPVADEEKFGGLGKWEALQPGHGIGFESDGNENKLSERFGVELSFARTLKELYPNEKIAIIKYARNGSSIDSLSARDWGSWEVDFKGKNGIDQYDHFLNTVKSAYADTDIDNNGIQDNLIPTGIVWMQGESDAHTERAGLAYYDNLSKLMNLINAAFRCDDLPIVIGKISDSGNKDDGKVWEYGELVQYAQEKYATEHNNATIVRSTKHYGYSDPYHYNSEGYLDLGKQFAEAIFKLQK